MEYGEGVDEALDDDSDNYHPEENANWRRNVTPRVNNLSSHRLSVIRYGLLTSRCCKSFGHLSELACDSCSSTKNHLSDAGNKHHVEDEGDVDGGEWNEIC